MKLHGLIWWVDRWRQSSAFSEMTLEQQGAYRNLLDEAWLRGGTLPDDDRILGKASGDARRWRYVKRAVMQRFHKNDEGWRNETLDHVLQQSLRRARNQKTYRQRLRQS